jgi:solute carrier family 25 (mitochondrial iron transporter), member 28/37
LVVFVSKVTNRQSERVLMILGTISAAALASVLTRLVTHPLDTLRINIQTQHQPEKPPNIGASSGNSVALGSSKIVGASKEGLLWTFKRLWSTGSLYRGFGISLLLSAPATAIYLATYEVVKAKMGDHNDELKLSAAAPAELSVNVNCDVDDVSDGIENILKLKSHPWFQISVAAATAECLSGLVWTPMELIKSNLMISRSSTPTTIQSNNISNHNTSTISFIRETVARNGWRRGLFRGYFLTLIVFVPHSIAFFQTFEYLQEFSPLDCHSFSTQLIFSAVAATAGCIVSHPFEVLKTNWQVLPSMASSRPRMTMLQFIRSELSKLGYKLFIRGLLARIIWLAPSSALSMGLFQEIKKLYDR